MVILSMKLGILTVYDNLWGWLDLEPDSSGLWRNCSSWHITLFLFFVFFSSRVDTWARTNLETNTWEASAEFFTELWKLRAVSEGQEAGRWVKSQCVRHFVDTARRTVIPKWGKTAIAIAIAPAKQWTTKRDNLMVPIITVYFLSQFLMHLFQLKIYIFWWLDVTQIIEAPFFKAVSSFPLFNYMWAMESRSKENVAASQWPDLTRNWSFFHNQKPTGKLVHHYNYLY